MNSKSTGLVEKKAIIWYNERNTKNKNKKNVFTGTLFMSGKTPF